MPQNSDIEPGPNDLLGTGIDTVPVEARDATTHSVMPAASGAEQSAEQGDDDGPEPGPDAEPSVAALRAEQRGEVAVVLKSWHAAGGYPTR